MNTRNILFAAVAALLLAPAAARAQETPEGDVPDLMEGPAQPDMQPGRAQRPGADMKGQKARNHKGMLGMEPGEGGLGQGGPVLLSEDETLATLKKVDADFAKKLDDLKTVAPAKYKNIVQMASRVLSISKMEQDEGAQKDIVRGLSLEFDIRELGMKYDKASDADKKALRETLRGKLSELFDLKTKGQEMRVAHMEKEIARLKKNLEKRKANKAKIVDQRLDQVTGEGFGW